MFLQQRMFFFSSFFNLLFYERINGIFFLQTIQIKGIIQKNQLHFINLKYWQECILLPYILIYSVFKPNFALKQTF